MRTILVAAATAAVTLAGAAHAEIPAFEAHCPGGVVVRAAAGDAVTFDGQAAEVEATGDGTWEASRKKDLATISLGADGAVAVSFEGGHTIGGACTVSAGN